MTTARHPAVAGQFYPGDPAVLERMVSELLEQVPGSSSRPVPKAIIVPHAGYIYSGPVAASAYAGLLPARDRIHRVVLLGPSHYVYLQGLAASSADRFLTPLGQVPVDLSLREQVLALPQVEINDAAHLREHSLEVQLPFLQQVLDRFTLLPLVVGEATPEAVAEVIETAWGGDETLVVVSSDLSHYHDYRTAQVMDRATTAAIERLDLRPIDPDHACGCRPVAGLLEAARRKGLAVTTLDLRNSGDTAGPRDQVVGYGAYALQ